MATFADMFNQAGQGLSTAFANPWTQLGMQMMAQSGWQPGNPNFGQRFGQAGMGFIEQQAATAAAQQKQLQQQMEMAKTQAEYEKGQREEKTRAAVQERVRNDNTFLADNPLARSILEATGDFSLIKNLPQTGPKAPNMPYQYDVRGQSGDVTQMTYNPATGGYTASAPYTPTDVLNARTGKINADTAQQRAVADQAERDRRYTLDAGKAEEARKKALHEQEAAALKSTIDRKTLETGYKGSVAQIDNTVTLIDDLLNDKGLDRLYGLTGMLPTIPGQPAADAQVKMARLRDMLGLSELIRLEQAGVKLTPVSNTDLETVKSSAGALDKLQSAEQARTELKRIRSVLGNAKAEATGRFVEYNKLYDLQTPQQTQQGGFSEDAYNALPSGATYIGPDGKKRIKR